MNKYMLKTGMVVKLRNNKKYMIINKTGYNLDDFIPLGNYNDDLTSSIKDSKDWDIMKVYKNDMNSIIEGFIKNRITLIWERIEDKEQINWFDIPKNTKVLVKNDVDDDWERKYFAKYENNTYRVYANGQTSWNSDRTIPYRYCILAEDYNEITAEQLLEESIEYCNQFGETCIGCKYDEDEKDCEYRWLVDNYNLSKK